MKLGSIVRAMLILGAALLAVGCHGPSQKEKDVREKSIEALNKIEAATEVGVNFSSYQQLLIDAKAKVNTAEEVLPNALLKSELHSSIDAYTDAAQVWNEKIQVDILEGYIVTGCESIGIKLIPKYSLPIGKIPVNKSRSSSTLVEDGFCGNGISSDEALRIIWQTANSHLKRSKELNVKQSESIFSR